MKVIVKILIYGSGAIGSNLGGLLSMLQDVRTGRPIECDAIVNSVIEVAEIYNITMPSLRVVASLLDLINQGLIREKKVIRLALI